MTGIFGIPARGRVRLSLKVRMALAVTLLITAALSVAGWLYARHLSESFRASVAAQQAATAGRMAAEIAAKFGTLRHQLELFALDLSPAILADEPRARERLKGLAAYHPILEDFWTFTADGRVTADYPPLSGRVGTNVADRAYFRRTIGRGEFLVSEPGFGRFSGQPRVVLIAPVHGPLGDVAGAVGGVIRLQSPRFLGELVHQTVGATGYVGVVSTNGVVLAHPRGERVMETLPPGRNAAFDQARAGFEGTTEALDSAGVATVYTFKRVAGADWIAYTAYPAAEAYGALQRDLRAVFGVVLLLALAGGIAAWVLMSRLLAPLATLERQMRRIAAAPHHPALLQVGRDDEIGDLTVSFNRMIESQREAAIERAAAHEQIQYTGRMFTALYERSPIGMALLRPDGSFVRSNPAFQKITGFTDDELAAMTETGISAPEGAAADACASAALRAGGAVAPYEKEYVARGGLRVPVRVSAVAVLDGGVNDCIWWIAEDIAARRQMMDALKQSESEARMLSAAASHTGNLVVITDSEGRIEWVNQAFERTSGYARAEVEGRHAGSFLHGPGTDPAIRAQMRAAIAAREPFAVEVINYAKDGRAYWVAIECAPVFDHLGRLERFVAIERDITAAKDSAEALRDSEEKYRRVFETASEVIWQFDRNGVITLLNPAWERLTGRLVADSVGRSFYEFMVPEQRSSAEAALRDIIAGRKAVFDETGAFITASGAARWFEIRAQVFTGDGGTPVCMGTLHDVHERRSAEAARRAAEEALRETQGRYQRAIESASDVVWERDLKSGRFFVSDRIFETLRIDRANAPEALFDVFMMVHPDDVEMHRRNVETLVARDDTLEWEARFRAGDGSYRWLRVRGKTIRDDSGMPVLTSGTASDVHDARTASEELRAMQVRYARALEGASDGIWEWRVDSDEIVCSDRVAEILRYAPGAVPARSAAWREMIYPEDLPGLGRALKAMHADGKSVAWDLRLRTGQGEYRWVRARGRVLRDGRDAPAVLAGTLTDVHDAKLAEDAMRDLQARYQRAMDGSNDGIWERTIDSDAFYFSERFDELLGYAPGAMPRMRAEWLKLVHPDDLSVHLAGVETMTGGDRAVMWEARYRNTAGTYRWLRMRGIAVRDAQGRAVLTSGTASDVHAAKVAEDELKRHRDNLADLVQQRTRRLEEATRAAEAARAAAEVARQAAVDANLAKSEFLANMSHELRTPMHGIISFANFGVERIDRVDTAKLLHYFRNIQKSAARLLVLLNDLLDLAKLEAGKMTMQRQYAELAPLVEEAVAEAEALARARDIDMQVDLVGKPAARLDSMRMLQVLRNLLSNAIKFTPEGGRVNITCRRTHADGSASSAIELCVRDNGVGIPQDELETVFDKFVQSSKTKTGAGGTGLGLPICREIVTAHGGTIHAQNNPPPQCGATLVVRLPVDEAALPARLLTEAV